MFRFKTNHITTSIIHIMSSPKSTDTSKTTFFKLTPISGETATNEIQTYTEDFDPKYKISQEFKDTILQNLAARPEELYDENGRINKDATSRGFLNVPDCETQEGLNIIRQVIGKGGCYFHMTTQNTGIDFIWHDRAQNKFFFWGTKYPLIRAMKIINSRLEIVKARMTTTDA